MIIGNKQVDHLVYCVPHLPEGIARLETLLGVKAVIGGVHKTKGTHNALISLGHQCYLEVLAIDPSSQVEGPRWMGIDYISKPKLTRWAVQSESIQQDANIFQSYNANLSQVSQGQRQTPDGQLLKWAMTLPSAHPEIELMPFLIDWSESQHHPADNLPKQCSLANLILSGPKNKVLKDGLENLLNVGGDFSRIDSEVVSITATISTPLGFVELT